MKLGHHRHSIIVCLLLLCCVPVDGQRAKTAADRRAAERKKQAQSLLITLASEARIFQDRKLRARSLVRIADALWETDAEQSRALFIKSWEAAVEADADPDARYNLGERPAVVREDVLVLIAKRDPVLADQLLQKLNDQAAAKTNPEESNLWHLSDAQEKRLDLARQLLRAGDIKQALEFAQPILGTVSVSTLDFLTDLRERDPAAADARYARLLRQTSGDPSADANTVCLLASYIFSPRTYVIFNAYGGAADAAWAKNPLPPADVGPQLMLMFFQTASDVLLRPLPTPDQQQTSPDIALRYLVIRRLLPLFEQRAPRLLTDAVRAQFEGLNSAVSDEVKDPDNDEWADLGITPEKTLAQQQQPFLDQVDRVRSSEERDNIYFKLANLALSKGDQTARDFVSKIADTEFRKRAQTWVDWGLAVWAIKQKKPDAALKFARADELSHIHRAWILTQSAELIFPADPERAVMLVDEATAEARRVDASDDRARGLLAVAHALLVVDPTRVWDALFEVVKAANQSEKFTGEYGSLDLTAGNSQEIRTTSEPVPEFNLKETLGPLARKNFDRAVQVVHGFERDAPRANATIIICRAILNERSTISGRTSDPK